MIRTKRSPFLVSFIASIVMVGCVDSELGGQTPGDDTRERDTTTREDTSVLTDATTTDVTVTDATTTDVTVTDAADIDVIEPDAGCKSDEACRGVLGQLELCLVPHCDLPTGRCETIDTCVSCAGDGDCQANAPACSRGRCQPNASGQNTCVYERTNACCEGPDGCNDADVCTGQVCSGGYCKNPPLTGPTAVNCCTTAPVITTTFAPTPPFQWRSDASDAGWSVVQSSMATSPEAVLYAGNKSTFRAYSNKPYQATATFTIGPVTPGNLVRIKFRAFADLRVGDADGFTVAVHDQVNHAELARKSDLVAGQWTPIYREIVLPNAGPWTLVFTFTVSSQPDGADLDHLGIMLDDLVVQANCPVGCEPGSACPSDDPCKVGRCGDDRQCSFEDVPGCGCDVAQCDDRDACTRDFCAANGCAHERLANCGCDASQCDDQNPCTQDFCAATGCAHQAIPDCGCVPERCDDQNPCTRDFCRGQECAHEPMPNCGCGNCNDNNPCTIDRCDPQANVCTHQRDPNCCSNNDDCRDGDMCTNDTCQADGVCRHERVNTPQCGGLCQGDSNCNDNNPCSVDACNAGVCSHTPRSCDDNNACTFDVCNPQGCQNLPIPGCQPCSEQLLWSRSFVDGETADLSIDGNSFSVGWRVDDVKTFSAPRALRYGNGEGTSYGTAFGGGNSGRATGPFIAVPVSAANVRLSFKVWIDVGADADKDLFRARVLYGDQNVQVWDRTALGSSTGGQWVDVSVDLPKEVIGNSMRVRFTFETVDGQDNDHAGVFVDDITIKVTCPTP